MKYAIKSICYDDGKLEVFPLRSVNDSAESYVKESKHCDIYFDVFIDYDKAKKFHEECKAAL